MRSLPWFSLDEYQRMIEAFVRAGYEVRTVGQMGAEAEGPVLYLRHDVDFHLFRQDEMAQRDAQAEVKSTFFVLVQGHYNPMLVENAKVLERIVGLGHEVGLHYDLRNYPPSNEEARARLEHEVRTLEYVTGKPVASISMHEPSAGHVDWFRNTESFVHPHADRFSQDLLYVSDSCRAWRDENLLRCFSEDRPRRVLLNTHGELWLDPTVTERTDYLKRVSAPSASHFANEYFHEYITSVWQTHEAARLDDERRASDATRDD